MPRISYRNNVAWHNFHRTRGGLMGPDGPEMLVQSLAAIDAADATQTSGLERFAATGTALLGHLLTLDARPETARYAAGTVGQGWSFSPLIGTPVSQLDALGLAGATMIAEDERHAGCRATADHVALASGGSTMADLELWAEKQSRMLHTSGSFLHPTIAGGAATSSHGSRLGFGGIQNMVLGMHLIVGSGEHVWIDRASAPVLSDAGLAKLTIDGKPPRLVRDDDKFEDALVHLGAMGIVNGVALELVDNHKFALMQRVTLLTPDFLQDIADGDFVKVAGRLNCTAQPLFYELTINPHRPFDFPVTNTMYFATGRQNLVPSGPADILTPADAISQLGAKLLSGSIATPAPAAAPAAELVASAPAGASIPPWVLPMLIGAESVFAFYLASKKYDMPNTPFDPEAEPPLGSKTFLWSELHDGTITSGIPGALYNASFAIPLECVAKAVPLICAAVQGLLPSFVFTVRIVEGAEGTLAFTRFDRNAVIEIDGLSPFICLAAKARIDPRLDYAAALAAALDQLAGTLPAGAAAVRKALDGAGIRYSMHWAKLGGLDKAKVYADYGHPRDPESLIHRWRATRDELLTDFGKQIFWNDAAVQYGLLDP